MGRNRASVWVHNFAWRLPLETALLFAVLLITSACGQGAAQSGAGGSTGGSSNCPTLGDAFSLGILYSNASSGTATGGCDPFAHGQYHTFVSTTTVGVYANWLASSWQLIFDLQFSGNSPGIFTYPALSFSYSLNLRTFCSSYIDVNTVTMTVNTYDPVGGRIQGTYGFNYSTAPPAACLPGPVAGSFDVTRQADFTGGF